MLIDFRDPALIRAWLQAAPERHRAQLRGLWRLWPQFRGSIEAAAQKEGSPADGHRQGCD